MSFDFVLLKCTLCGHFTFLCPSKYSRPFLAVNPILKAPFTVLNRQTHEKLIYSRSKSISWLITFSWQMEFEFGKQKIITGSQIRWKRGMWENIHLFRLKKLGHNAYLMGGSIIMQKAQVLESCFRAASLEVCLQLFQNNIFTECSCDGSALWNRQYHNWTFIVKENTYDTFLAVHCPLTIHRSTVFL